MMAQILIVAEQQGRPGDLGEHDVQVDAVVPHQRQGPLEVDLGVAHVLVLELWRAGRLRPRLAAMATVGLLLLSLAYPDATARLTSLAYHDGLPLTARRVRRMLLDKEGLKDQEN